MLLGLPVPFGHKKPLPLLIGFSTLPGPCPNGSLTLPHHFHHPAVLNVQTLPNYPPLRQTLRAFTANCPASIEGSLLDAGHLVDSPRKHPPALLPPIGRPHLSKSLPAQTLSRNFYPFLPPLFSSTSWRGRCKAALEPTPRRPEGAGSVWRCEASTLGGC